MRPGLEIAWVAIAKHKQRKRQWFSRLNMDSKPHLWAQRPLCTSLHGKPIRIYVIFFCMSTFSHIKKCANMFSLFVEMLISVRNRTWYNKEFLASVNCPRCCKLEIRHCFELIRYLSCKLSTDCYNWKSDILDSKKAIHEISVQTKNLVRNFEPDFYQSVLAILLKSIKVEILRILLGSVIPWILNHSFEIK